MQKAFKYIIQYRRESDKFYWEETDTLSSPLIALSDLLPGETYQYQIKTICNQNISSEFSNIKTFTTNLICNPISSDKLFVDSITTHSAQLQINELSEQYYYRYRATHDTVWQGEFTSHIPILNISGLKPNTSYEFQISMYCNSSEKTEWSPLKSFTTTISTAIEGTLNKLFFIFPNPTQDEISIKSQNRFNSLHFKIFDISGKMCLQGKVNNDQKINIHYLNSGVYFLHLIHQGQQANFKFIKQ